MKSPADVSYGPNDIIIGDKDAPVEIFVYTSYRCTYCIEFFETTYLDLKNEYIDNGQAKIIIKNIGYSNDSISLLAVKAAYCAYGEGRFFDVHMKLLNEYDVINKATLINWFAELNIDSTQFNTCINNEVLNQLIADNRKEMRMVGAKGTPAFVIGDEVINGNRAARLKELIELEIVTCCE
jgi:protein-disulfide isomerase